MLRIVQLLGNKFYTLYMMPLALFDKLGVSDFCQYKVRTMCIEYLLFLAKSRSSWFNNRGLPDNLPVPPPKLLFLVRNSFDKYSFYSEGALGAKCIKEILKKNGLDINKFGSILDFGCGCGRILRHWKTLDGPMIYGCDYNPAMARWCQKSLTFAQVKQNKTFGKLDYDSESFDFIYAISVFTHLSERLQNFWINELTRILKSGGYLLITVHGTTSTFAGRPSWVREKFNSGQLIVLESQRSGTNYCNTYHPEAFLRTWLSPKLNVVDFVPGGAKDANQDACLLQKSKKII